MREAIRQKLGISDAELEEFCRRWNILELSIFGSALRDDFSPDSDVDLMVRYGPADKRSLIDHIKAEDELAGLLGRKVDLSTRKGVESSKNWIIRSNILDSAEVIYESR